VKIRREPLTQPPYYVSQTQLQLRAVRLAQRWYGGIGSGDSSALEDDGLSFETSEKTTATKRRSPEDLNSTAVAVAADSFVCLFVVKFKKQGWPQTQLAGKECYSGSLNAR